MDQGLSDTDAALPTTLADIARLIAAADAAGAPVDPWIVELADALRATTPGTPSATDLAGMMRNDPAATIGAQEPVAPAAARLLKS